jgi:hypothetical protein
MTQEELFEHIREWNAFVRSHNANIFDVMFKDVDYSLKDDELYSIISDIAHFSVWIFLSSRLIAIHSQG